VFPCASAPFILWVVILPTSALGKYPRQVVMADGSFDCLHHGHIAYLREAASLGYPVLVNLCPDAETAKKHPVLLPANQRAQVLDALGCVAYVHVSDKPTVDVLRDLQPAFYVKGVDWVDRLPEAIGQVCDELAIRIRYVSTPKVSSTALLKRFQPDVDAFEQLVLSQTKPDDWQPVTDYREETRMPLERPQAACIAADMQPRSVLDYGCGFGYLLAALREVLPQANLRGYDPRMGTIATRADGVRVSYEEPFDTVFDLVVCREVLEHCQLVEWRRVIRTICEMSSRFLYVTTRFNEHPAHLLDIQTSDDLDPTHCTLPPQDLLRALIVLEGFKRRADLEQRMDWQHKGRVLVYERAA
jgi:cytidyltransferase-like protein